MSRNYDSSVAGTPFYRLNSIHVTHPGNGKVTISYNESKAVKLVDGTLISLDEPQVLKVDYDIATQGSTNVPLINATTGVPTGGNTTLNTLLLALLAFGHAAEVAYDTANGL